MTSDNIIENWSGVLAERITEIRFVDMDVMKAAIKIHIKEALYECLKIQLPITYSMLSEAKIEYARCRNNNTEIQSKIISLKQKLKEQNKLYGELDRENMGKELTLWLRKNGENLLLEFYEYYNSNFKKPINQ